jgi:hypothetical protein
MTALWMLLGVLVGQEPQKPVAFQARGKLVCLSEEMKERYQAQSAPIHEHQMALRVEGDLPEGGLRYYVLLRNALSEALFADSRFKDRDLRLTGRRFPSSGVIEVARFQGYRQGKLLDLYYWCPVCAIRGVDPGPCSCCQGAVEFRESPAVDEK